MAAKINSTIIGAVELSEKKWVLAVQLPGVSRHSRHVLDACGDGLVGLLERLKARCAASGRKIARVILTYEAGRDGFWLARFLGRRNIEVIRRAPISRLRASLDRCVHDLLVIRAKPAKIAIGKWSVAASLVDGVLVGAPVVNRTWGHVVAVWDYTAANLKPNHKLEPR